MWLESDSVYPYQSPYIGDDDEHTESALPFSVCSHLSPYIGDEDRHTETYLPFSVSPLSSPRNALYRAIGRGGSPSGVRVGLRALLRASAEPTHDLARTPAFGSSGVSFYILGSLSPSLEILGIIPKE